MVATLTGLRGPRSGGTTADGQGEAPEGACQLPACPTGSEAVTQVTGQPKGLPAGVTRSRGELGHARERGWARFREQRLLSSTLRLDESNQGPHVLSKGPQTRLVNGKQSPRFTPTSSMDGERGPRLCEKPAGQAGACGTHHPGGRHFSAAVFC